MKQSTKQVPAVPPAILDALATPAAPAGKVRTRGIAPKRFDPEKRNRPVRVAQPAAHDWTCESCGVIGYGGQAILDHHDTTGHTRFEAREATS